MRAADLNDESERLKDKLAILEWCTANTRALLENRGPKIVVGDRTVQEMAVQQVVGELMTLAGACRLRIDELGNYEVTPKLRDGGIR